MFLWRSSRKALRSLNFLQPSNGTTTVHGAVLTRVMSPNGHIVIAANTNHHNARSWNELKIVNRVRLHLTLKEIEAKRPQRDPRTGNSGSGDDGHDNLWTPDIGSSDCPARRMHAFV